MGAPRIYTYADAIEDLEDFAAARGAELQSQRVLRGSIRAAYDEIPQICNWPTLNRPGRIQLIAPYSTGTVVYDHTGGTYERQLTLTDGTWPSWAIDGVVRLSDVISHVESRKSGTVITLDATMNPGVDVASTTYSLFKQWYVLPEEFTGFTGPVREDTGYMLSRMSMTEMLQIYRRNYSTDRPRWYAIAEAPDLLGSLAIYLWPVKSEAGTLDYVISRRPRRLQHSGYSPRDYAGTIDVTAGSATVSGTGTSFSDSMLGAVIRIGSDTTHRPTGLEGDYPFVEERSVSAVGSTTSLTLDNDIVTSRSGVKYTVSSPIDLSVSLRNAFLRHAEKNYAQKVGMEGMALIEANATSALLLAMGTRHTEMTDSGGQYSESIPGHYGVPTAWGTSSFE